jgi:hypothetical protein
MGCARRVQREGQIAEWPLASVPNRIGRKATFLRARGGAIAGWWLVVTLGWAVYLSSNRAKYCYLGRILIKYKNKFTKFQKKASVLGRLRILTYS